MLKEKIDTNIILAMKAKDEVTLRTLRSLKSAITMVETQKGHSGNISESEEFQVLSKQIKQRKESLEMYNTNNRLDLAKIEEDEITILESLLPKQLSKEELTEEISIILKDQNLNFGQAMKLVMGKVKGDNKIIADIIKSLI